MTNALVVIATLVLALLWPVAGSAYTEGAEQDGLAGLVQPDKPACWGKSTRSRVPVKAFRKKHPCPKSCATYTKNEQGRYVLYLRCGACQVDHICPLACCGADHPSNMQWLPSWENQKKGADCSECSGQAGKEK
jgi:hypothetical protein